MINPETLDLTSLPSVSLDNLRQIEETLETDFEVEFDD